jgi:hypothetical protein
LDCFITRVDPPQDSRSGWIRYFLSCRALASPTTCRFIPAHSGLPVIPPTIGQTPNGAPKPPQGNCRGVRTLHLSGSVLVRIYLRTREVDRLRCAFSMGHQKFSICHTFLAPVSSVMASDRPSGDGIAEKTSLRECSSTEALPSRVTFNNVLSPS